MGASGIDIVVQVERFTALPYWQAMSMLRVPPHVSILYPWRASPLADSDITEVRRVVGSRAPFPIVFDTIATFENGAVYAHVEASAPLSSLMRDFWDAFPETPPYGGEFEAPVPHLTLAKPAVEKTGEVVAELTAQVGPHLPLRFDVHSVTILEQTSDATWRTAGMVRLTGE